MEAQLRARCRTPWRQLARAQSELIDKNFCIGAPAGKSVKGALLVGLFALLLPLHHAGVVAERPPAKVDEVDGQVQPHPVHGEPGLGLAPVLGNPGIPALGQQADGALY